MRDASSTLTAFDRHSLFEACSREAERLGGDERTAEYFFGRAQSSRVWLSEQGAVAIADMDIADWCGAIAWSAPGIGRSPKKIKPAPPGKAETKPPSRADHSTQSDPQDEQPAKKQPRSGARAKLNRAN